jgi:hypothetical protein
MSRRQVSTQRQLQNTRGGYYSGATNNPERRMREHIRDGLMKPGGQLVGALSGFRGSVPYRLTFVIIDNLCIVCPFAEQMVYARTQSQCYAEDRLGPRRYSEQSCSNAPQAPGYTYVLRK